MINKILAITRDIIKNVFGKEKLIYIVESLDWSIKWDGIQITSSLNKLNLIKSDIRVTTLGLRNKIVHFGSVNTYINIKNGFRQVHPSNKVVLTWFHVEAGDPKLKYIPKLNDFVEKVHTSCEKTKNILLESGLKSNKIMVIPLGVDTNVFKIIEEKKKLKLKKDLNISEDKIIIGSFQKDGVGWGEGLIPKLIKGPDIFCDAIEEISKNNNLHILLTGPSRGYVKQRLEKMDIPYTHVYLKKYLDIVDYYNIIDLYIISSRVEGGPKALLECWATGVPVISTEVGMVPDISLNGKNVLIAKVNDVNEIVRLAAQILNDDKMKLEMINFGHKSVQDFSWEIISKKYFDNIYNPINQ